MPFMMTSSNGNFFRVTDPLSGEFTGIRWIPRTKASDAELWCFFDLRLIKRLSKHSRGWWFNTLSRPLWRHYNVWGNLDIPDLSFQSAHSTTDHNPDNEHRASSHWAPECHWWRKIWAYLPILHCNEEQWIWYLFTKDNDENKDISKQREHGLKRV